MVFAQNQLLQRVSSPVYQIEVIHPMKDGVIVSYKDFILGFVIIAIPFALIAKQPDLGTGILVFSAGFFVLFFACLPWKVMIISLVSIVASSPLIWGLLKDYLVHLICFD